MKLKKESPVGLKVNIKDTKRKRLIKYELVYKWKYPVHDKLYERGTQ